MTEQKTKEELKYKYGECYRLNHSKLTEILTQIKEKGKETNTYFGLLKDGIYINGELRIFKTGEGEKTTHGYVARIIDGSAINKDSSLYLQTCAKYDDESGKEWEVSYTIPNLVDILREFII